MTEVFWSHYGLPYPGPLISYVTPSYLGLRVGFFRPVHDSSVLRDPTTWTITYIGDGAAVTPTITLVTPEAGGSPEYVDLVCTDLTDGKDYRISVSSGVIEDSSQIAYFISGLYIDYLGVSSRPDIESLVALSYNSMVLTFSRQMDQNSEFLSTESYSFDNSLFVRSIVVETPTSIILFTSSQRDVVYTLTTSTTLQDVWLNLIDDNTASARGIRGPIKDDVSNQLRTSDKEKIIGWGDISRPEVEQLDVLTKGPKPEVAEPTASKRLDKTKSQAQRILNRIDGLTQEIDRRCARFKVSSKEDVGSSLFQAMTRVFGERTTEITYDHYKRALEYRQQLAEEDTAKLRLE
jgi:hypothetical protein